MKPTKTTLSLLGQVTKLIPAKLTESLAEKHNIKTRSFNATSHVTALIFAQLTHSLSLNDVCDALQNHQSHLSKVRNSTPPSRNGFSHANRTRNADMAEELFWNTLERLKSDNPDFMNKGRSYPGLPHRFTKTIHAVDSSTLQLVANCMSWAKHRRQKAAAKLHMSLNMQSFLPSFAIVRKAKDSDPKVAWEICGNLKSGEIVVFDKAYVDFKHLAHLDQRGVFWVSRSKTNMQYEVMGQHKVKIKENKDNTGKNLNKVMGQQVSKKRKYKRKKISIISDEDIKLITKNTLKNFPKTFRIVTASVEIKGVMKKMSFITNNMEWSAISVCELYQARWGVEVFFKEIKQTLQLSDFMGYNENAVRWQIWIALLVYVILRFIAWKNKWTHSFNRLFTLIRGVIWNYFDIASIMNCCDKMGKRKIVKATPEKCYQMVFDFPT